jgi:hypothetical protein
MTDRREQQAREHFEKYDKLAQWLGVAELQALVPFSQERVNAALASGDEHLNTLSLAAWDRQHGTIPGEAAKRCPCCHQVLPQEEQPRGVWDLVRAAIKRDKTTGSLPLCNAWSLSDTVCVLKHVARYYPRAIEATHTLRHAIHGCGCNQQQITHCVMCGRKLDASHHHTDTCGEVCYRKLLVLQRRAAYNHETENRRADR